MGTRPFQMTFMIDCMLHGCMKGINRPIDGKKYRARAALITLFTRTRDTVPEVATSFTLFSPDPKLLPYHH